MIWLKNVVLPAPFGPISETMPPRGIVKSMSFGGDEPAELLADPRRDEEVSGGRHQSSLESRSVSVPSWVTSYRGVSCTPSAISILCRRSGISPVGRKSIISTMITP